AAHRARPGAEARRHEAGHHEGARHDGKARPVDAQARRDGSPERPRPPHAGGRAGGRTAPRPPRSPPTRRPCRAPPQPPLTALRPDRGAARRKRKGEGERFVAADARRVTAFSAPLKRTPAAEASLDSEVLRGEVFRVFEETKDGWPWGQLETDSYVGYVPS